MSIVKLYPDNLQDKYKELIMALVKDLTETAANFLEENQGRISGPDALLGSAIAYLIYVVINLLKSLENKNQKLDFIEVIENIFCDHMNLIKNNETD